MSLNCKNIMVKKFTVTEKKKQVQLKAQEVLIKYQKNYQELAKNNSNEDTISE